MEWLAEHIPSATLCALDGVGHFPFVEASAQFTQLVARSSMTTITLPCNRLLHLTKPGRLRLNRWR
jgi:hypothetical protein